MVTLTFLVQNSSYVYWCTWMIISVYKMRLYLALLSFISLFTHNKKLPLLGNVHKSGISVKVSLDITWYDGLRFLTFPTMILLDSWDVRLCLTLSIPFSSGGWSFSSAGLICCMCLSLRLNFISCGSDFLVMLILKRVKFYWFYRPPSTSPFVKFVSVLVCMSFLPFSLSSFSRWFPLCHTVKNIINNFVLRNQIFKF